ncbi:glycosyl hydrolase family 18 protein [Lachnoclostridium phytofermentans]|uniref:Peptidoglycan-binding LysM n=1 Tax=Lachnoclostridium phytofermentans (strain ATCC 700394 / DSM 18823 / ISDg) TaxID=357809 RepID=A9KRF0_LACP7|nr:glycosyl hydrolase family 18 protein [Lachnoclostridium phytofermentans]ABX42024.1 Peptidoglycan-binding LysM [Lachnoclostridium phytofermentans ISDg]
MEIHVVKPGDSVLSIANQYGVSVQRLIFDNEIYTPENLVVGQALLILHPTKIYQVKPGDTLYSIAQDFQVSVISLIRNNPYIIQERQLSEGQVLVITYEGVRDKIISTNGYVYPYVNRQVLEQTLPYLTNLSIFSYGFTTEGELIPIDDDEVLEITTKHGVGPVLTLTPLDENGMFNNALVSAVAQNVEVRDHLIDELLAVVKEKQYVGVNVDFEYIKAEDRIGFAEFVAELTRRMNEEDFFVSVALAPKTSENQPGLLYEGMDYRLLGEAANSVLLMTYEWGYTYSEPMAVAPINKVREVLDFAVTQIPVDRIDMGIPNYGYDWALPYVKGETRARAIGNIEAVQIAAANNAVIQFDEVAQTPFFTYTREGVDHEVWFEDVRSIKAKLDLVKEYDFRGVGYWQLMRLFRPNWLLLNSMFEIL